MGQNAPHVFHYIEGMVSPTRSGYTLTEIATEYTYHCDLTNSSATDVKINLAMGAAPNLTNVIIAMQ